MIELIATGLGLITGILLGLTGAGGGIIAAPLLMLVLHVPATQAAPISLMAVALGAGFAMVMGLREGVVRYRAAMLMAAMGLLASPLGIRLALTLPNKPLVLAFALLLGYQAWRQWHGTSTHRDEAPSCELNANTGRFKWNRPCARTMAGAGLAAGFLSGLLGVGGGFVLVPALRKHTPLSMHAIAATSLMTLTLVSSGGVALWMANGGINWRLALPFAAGTMAGIFVGRQASSAIEEKRLHQAFAIACLLACVGLLAKILAN
ncbi:MAG TPA: sulfite exporter TauE/SafE family protein [Rhodocyclaceae bacterium]|nr:sulfite exporter TauE/SafE family protein [Rhodocyclaceae bacterium]